LFAKLNEQAFKAFLTLTTKTALDNKQFKKVLNKFLEQLKLYNIAALWVVELQERGALHVHLLLTSTIDYHVVARIWSDAQYCFTSQNIMKTCSNIQKYSPKHTYYLAKYLTSQLKSQICFSGRRWGYSCREQWRLPLCAIKEMMVKGVRNEYFVWDLIKNDMKMLDKDLFVSDLYDLVMTFNGKVAFDVMQRYDFYPVVEVNHA
jgi:hypothetical protein